MTDLLASHDVHLSPSEAALLRPERFSPADTALSQGHVPLLGGGKVQLTTLAEALVAVALLACQDAGVLRLEAQKKKWFLGLFTRSAFMAIPEHGRANWPVGSLEAAIASAMTAGVKEVPDLVYHILEQDAASPTEQVVSLVTRGLADRGRLERRESRTLKVFTTTSFHPTERLTEVLEARGTGAEEALIAAARARPDFWKALIKGVGGGIGLRQARDSSD